MKIARFNGGRIGVVRGERIYDVSEACGVDPADWPPVGMIRTIASFEALRSKIEAAVKAGSGRPLAEVRLQTPVPWPNKMLALPNNYAAHTAEMRGRAYAVGTGAAPDQAGFFMKANSSMIGPADAIELPDKGDREFHHECELAIIIGKRARNVTAAEADAYIFGYACLIDVTMRGKEERVMRKSYETFTPIGPWITTSDEVGPTDDVELKLWVNSQLRQHAFAREMIVGIREAVELCSAVTTLEPGDVIASGTMAGVGPLVPGDEVTITIDRVGSMTLPVRLTSAVTSRTGSGTQ
jgi:2-keto-4-pentenoate hydratase/2-oxohepta-3-ene-1,7-dioic acid hydratase in catechol pathway